jgi:hypothetical protein
VEREAVRSFAYIRVTKSEYHLTVNVPEPV